MAAREVLREDPDEKAKVLIDRDLPLLKKEQQ
jgi:hypothetical protein